MSVILMLFAVAWILHLDIVITPSAKAEGFSRLRGRLLLATPNVWRRLLGIGYPGHLIRGPNVLVLLESKSQPARK